MTDEPRSPGWYPDPWSATEGETRYFDGTAWVANEQAARGATVGARRSQSRWWIGPLVLLAGTVAVFAATGGFHESTTRRATIKIGTGSSTSSTRPHVDLQERSYQRGDCATWKQVVGEPRVVKTVTCDGAHLFEMIQPVELKGLTGPYPTEAAWNLIFEQQCAPLVASYLGAPIDPYGRYGASGLEVGQEGWDLGERTIWCGVAEQGVSPLGPYALVPALGRAHGNDQTKLYGIGTCLGPIAAGGDDLVDCGGPHQIEVTGSVDLTGRIDHAPNVSELDVLALDACKRLATTYVGHSLGTGVAAAPFGLEPASWAAGRRIVECVVGHTSGTDWVSSSGSMRAGA